ncbi:hypothetical protein K438DRAFT_1840093 [Mycena galopus ATCC 62051]|nr:hypothetical protein K438DRAFT_1840093 [Mycena galopus ATCC 62051]
MVELNMYISIQWPECKSDTWKSNIPNSLFTLHKSTPELCILLTRKVQLIMG